MHKNGKAWRAMHAAGKRGRFLSRHALGLGCLLGVCAFAPACGLLLKLPDPYDGTDQIASVGGGGGMTLVQRPAADGGSPLSLGGFGGAMIVVEVAGAFSVPDDPDGDGCSAPCDCDGDGYVAVQCDGEDCDDFDGRVHPGQKDYFGQRAPNEDVGFDYNCSGVPEREPIRDKVVSCGLLGIAGCNGQEGFEGKLPECGETGTWSSCEPDGLLCASVPIDSQLKALCR